MIAMTELIVVTMTMMIATTTMMTTRTTRTTMMMTMRGELVILMEGFCLARLGGCRKENKAAQTSIELFP